MKPHKRPGSTRRQPSALVKQSRKRGVDLSEGKTSPPKRGAAKKGVSTKKRVRISKHLGSKKPPVKKKNARKRKAARTSLPSGRRSSLVWLLLAPMLILGALALGLGAFTLAPGPGDGASVELQWKKGMSSDDAAKVLADAGLVRSAWLMSLYLSLERDWDVDPGSHLLRDDMSPRTLLRRLRRLQGGTRVDVVVPEGFNKFDLAQRLQAKGICSKRGFLVAVADEALMRELRVPSHDAEGYLFPATYPFVRNSAPSTVVRRLVNEASKRYARLFGDFPEAIAQLEKDLGWDRHSIIILASIVEKEAAVDDERPVIASVFLNRMYSETFRPRQRLQSDPTARYGCLLQPDVTPTCAGAERGVTGPMVRDPLNAYSTYAHRGLPPGPICNPGAKSIRAVLNPANTEFLFFVAQGRRRHRFSKTFGEHLEAIPKDQ